MSKLTFAASFLLSVLGPLQVLGQRGAEVFRIGQKNNTFTEFARTKDIRDGVRFIVGQSSPEKDWPSYQPGSFDAAVSRSTMQRDWTETKPGLEPVPFDIKFQLADRPQGTFVLHLNALFRYRRPAAPRYQVVVNGGAAASYRLNPHPAPELWWPNGGEAEGNTQYFGYESLDMPLSASRFRIGINTISLQILDGFGIYYDSLSLSNDVTPRRVATSGWVTPLALYKNTPSGLVELASIKLRSMQPLGRVILTTKVGSNTIETQAKQDEAGDLEATIEVPAVENPVPVALYVAGQRDPVFRGTFTPVRKWQIYALSMDRQIFAITTCRRARWNGKTASSTKRLRSSANIHRILSRWMRPPTLSPTLPLAMESTLRNCWVIFGAENGA